jgi:2'-5' RNA ligase
VALPVEAGAWFAGLPAPPTATRLFAAEDLHVTVAFLGAVDDRAALRAFGAARARAPAAMWARLGSVHPFGSKRNPSALSAEVEDEDDRVSSAIVDLRAPLLEAAGARPDRRPPRPHVTLARIARRARPEERRAALAWGTSLDLGAPRLPLHRLALYTWARDRRRSLFRIVETFGLEFGPHVPGS